MVIMPVLQATDSPDRRGLKPSETGGMLVFMLLLCLLEKGRAEDASTLIRKCPGKDTVLRRNAARSLGWVQARMEMSGF